MIKMYVEMDREKIEREGLYDYERIMQTLELLFKKNGLTKDANGWYENGGYAEFGGIVLYLQGNAWFIDNVKSWLMYDHYELKDIYAPTDLIRIHKKMMKRDAYGA